MDNSDFIKKIELDLENILKKHKWSILDNTCIDWFCENVITYLEDNLPNTYKDDGNFIISLCEKFRNYCFLRYASDNLMDDSNFALMYIDSVIKQLDYKKYVDYKDMLNSPKYELIGVFDVNKEPGMSFSIPNNICLDIFSKRLQEKIDYHYYEDRGIIYQTEFNYNALAKLAKKEKDRDNKEYQIKLISKNWEDIKNVSLRLSNDIEILKIALKQSILCLEYMGKDLRNNIEFAKYAIAFCKDGNLIKYFEADIRNNKDVCDIALSYNEESIQYMRDVKNNYPILYDKYKHKGWFPI